jgi:plasmid stability protein
MGVATLNIKGLPDAIYRRLKARAKSQHRSVTQEVIRILDEATGERQRLSILELRGLGKDVWRGVDAAAHVESERGSWD